MPPKDWTKHPNGQVQVFPVTGWKTATTMGGKAGVLRIEFGLEPTLKKRDSRQLIMQAGQARALSETLAKLADRLEAKAAQSEPDGPIN